MRTETRERWDRWACKTLAVACCAALPLAALAEGAAPRARAARLNDTGMTICYLGGWSSSCAGTGQDADAGRDKTVNDDSDGKAGFSFVKISSTGAALPADATEWSCVKDKVTGLLWELKTDDGGLRDKDNLYSNYGDGRDGDTSAYVAAVNAQALCGSTQWRLPTRLESHSLLDYSRVLGEVPAIDPDWFPNSGMAQHWTSSHYAANAPQSWTIDYFTGESYPDSPNDNYVTVRLVASPAPVAAVARFAFRAAGAEVVDGQTGLVWRRCVEGMFWTGSACVGRAGLYTWGEALSHANEVASSSGKAWRLPNLKELASLVDETRVSPAIDVTVFPDTPTKWTWSATAYQGHDPGAGGVNFDTGFVADLYQTGHNPARLVRGGP